MFQVMCWMLKKRFKIREKGVTDGIELGTDRSYDGLFCILGWAWDARVVCGDENDGGVWAKVVGADWGVVVFHDRTRVDEFEGMLLKMGVFCDRAAN